MFQNFIRIIICGIIIGGTNLHAAAAVGEVGVSLTFSDEHWVGIPAPGEVSVEDVMKLFSDPLESNSRKWSLSSFADGELKAIMEDEFEVRTLMDKALFAHQPFEVDSEGYIRYEVFLVSLTKIMPYEEGDKKEFALNTRLPIVTKLTDSELENPIVKAVQSNLSFEEQSNLYRRNPEEFKRTQGIKKVHDLLIFVRPERVTEFEEALAKEID